MQVGSVVSLSALCLFGLGAFVWMLCPVTEARAGDRGALGSLVGGLSLLSASSVLGVAAAPHAMSSYLAPALICWAFVVYIRFRSVSEGLVPKVETSERHCVPMLISGSPTNAEFRESSFRTRLTARFYALPTNCSLDVTAYGSARAYYILFYSKRTYTLKPIANVVCQVAGDHGCRIMFRTQGMTEYIRSPLLLRIDYQPTVADDALVVRVAVSAATTAAGGSLGGSFGVGASVGLPNHSCSIREEMGTFEWCCS